WLTRYQNQRRQNPPLRSLTTLLRVGRDQESSSTTSIFREIAHGRRKCLIAVEMLLIYEQPYETVNGTTDVKLTPDDTKMDDGPRRGRYSRW
ncbi:unnamed protein product, partial [Brassica oleracea var. botrytis]